MTQEGKKKGSNRFKTAMWDYYLTNREVSKQYDEANKKEKGEKREWHGSEKIYLAVIVLCVLLIILKYGILK